jgi:adenylate cyclase
MKLTIVEEGARSEVEIDRPVVSIGRAVDNDIRLAATQVSRHHCRIETGAEGTWLVDLGSANGTSVNGERVTRRVLSPGDRITIGGVRITLDGDGAVRAPSAGDTQALDIPDDARDGAEEELGYRTLTGEALKERDDLHVFAQITRELARETELEPLLRRIVDSAVGLVGAERGFLLLADEKKPVEERRDVGTWSVRVARSFDRADIQLPHSRFSLGIARRVVESGRALLSVDAGRDERFAGMASVEDLKLRSVMALPIRGEGRVDGVLFVDNRLQRQAFREEDLDLAELFADQAAIALAAARRLRELEAQNRRLQQSQRQIELLNDQLGSKVRDRDTDRKSRIILPQEPYLAL